MGCHFLLQCMKVKSESEVAQSCPTLCDPMDCSLPGSSIHGIFQAKWKWWRWWGCHRLLHDQPRQHIKKQRHYFANKGPSSQGYGFSSGHVWMWELNCKGSWAQKNWCFWTVVLNIHWKEWMANTLATWCKELTHLKRPWCWERLKAAEGDDRWWDGWMASLSQWTWVWVSSGSWWWTGKRGCCSPWGLKESDTTELNCPLLEQREPDSSSLGRSHHFVFTCCSVAQSQLFEILWTAAHQAPLSMDFSRQEYWSGLPFPFSGESYPPKDQTGIFCIGRWIVYHWATWEALDLTWQTLKEQTV